MTQLTVVEYKLSRHVRQYYAAHNFALFIANFYEILMLKISLRHFSPFRWLEDTDECGTWSAAYDFLFVLIVFAFLRYWQRKFFKVKTVLATAGGRMSTGVARGCSGCTPVPHLTPQGGEKIRRNLQGEMCKCTSRTRSAPQPEQKSILGHFALGGLDLEVYLDRLLRATTKKLKRSSTFLTKKVHPQT